ncbi:MAG: bifunctional riboflavin kinase/FAD synthetase, partial [Ruminococcus sp.]|nr:bifunctional riboflavin kinase/FAD synthetase [Ruminococcus sp.]
MEYLKIDGEFPRLSKSAVTLGKFDGIHRGHQKLVEKILEQKEKGLQTVLFSLGIGSQMIFTKDERCQLLEKAGVDVLIECPLDNRIRHMKAETFVKEILVGDLQAEHVAVGEDFRFGYERKGTPQLLETMGRKLGFTVDVVPKEMEGRRKISSTFIREELKKGNMEKVNDLLGIPFFVDGVIEHGRGMGHRDFFPTANIIPPKSKL